MAQSRPKLRGAYKHRIILKKAGCLTDGPLTRLIFPLRDYGGVRGGLTTPHPAVNWKLEAYDITVPRTKRATGLENGRANARLGLILVGDSRAGGETETHSERSLEIPSLPRTEISPRHKRWRTPLYTLNGNQPVRWKRLTTSKSPGLGPVDRRGWKVRLWVLVEACRRTLFDPKVF